MPIRLSVFARRISTASVLGMAGILATVGCAPPPGQTAAGGAQQGPSGPAVKIGYIGPLSGSSSASGISARNGALLAAEHVNEAGGVNGSPIELLPKDDEGNADKGVAAAKELVEAGAIAVIGPNFSGVSARVVDEVLKPAGIVAISPASTAPSLSTLGATGYFFRTIPQDNLQGGVMAGLLSNRGHANVLVLNRTNAYGTGLAAQIKSHFEQPGNRTATVVDYGDTATPDYAAIKAKIPSGATAVGLVGYNEDGSSRPGSPTAATAASNGSSANRCATIRSSAWSATRPRSRASKALSPTLTGTRSPTSRRPTTSASRAPPTTSAPTPTTPSSCTPWPWWPARPAPRTRSRPTSRPWPPGESRSRATACRASGRPPSGSRSAAIWISTACRARSTSTTTAMSSRPSTSRGRSRAASWKTSPPSCASASATRRTRTWP
ncbi:MAG: ABC transporter substrate-binding protein [Candidatus Sericytochromatia bacterium]|nr:ABC transporter substrate-binding protein [Candidatus Tanganyikabacteria bacterium]